MICLHRQIATSSVGETRRVGDEVYRRRKCSQCGGAFVTLETAPADLKMPAEVWATRDDRPRLVPRKLKPRKLVTKEVLPTVPASVFTSWGR